MRPKGLSALMAARGSRLLPADRAAHPMPAASGGECLMRPARAIETISANLNEAIE